MPMPFAMKFMPHPAPNWRNNSPHGGEMMSSLPTGWWTGVHWQMQFFPEDPEASQN